ncbi:GRPE1-like protein [Mya arenaria]|uniref:GrpE protein homolog n=1 Tax=Mya arenaria TaxID=6604 RepID=A0ABY7FJ53_MYAAR|nr:grpE protein homolog 1, mitochondrial-like [Mya arenaria]WAR22213.1 GRPE1-like protein [Mya arenaria]
MAAPVCFRSSRKISPFARYFLQEKRLTGSLVQRLCTATTANNSSQNSHTSNNGINKEAEQKSDSSVADLEKKLKDEGDKFETAKKKFAEDLKALDDKYKRALAETENVRTRMRKQVEDAKVFGIQGFCKDLLEVADVLDQATQSVPSEELKKNEHLNTLFKGLNMTNTQLLKVFSRHGLTKLSPEVGEKFDPYVHEALFEVPAAEGQDGGTVAVCQKTGFKLHERTLRPATVGVFKS